MIILSILTASGLIMYLYRKNYSDIKHSNILKYLIIFWVFQNLIMLFSTVCRNQIYIQSFNLTYKRIGVYFWLALAALGLVITFYKVIKEKSNWYLIRSNFALWITVLNLSGCINWDLYITDYNLQNKPLTEVDFYYLFSLSDSNIPELIKITKHDNFNAIRNNLKVFTNTHEEYYHNNYISLLNSKLYRYVCDYNPDWRSFDLRDLRINKYIIK